MTLRNRFRALPAAALAAVALLALAPAAEAHGSRWRGGVDVRIGVPLWGYWGPRWYYDYAPPPVVYAPPPVAYPRVYSPPVYVERDDDERPPATAPQAPVWWYWCPSARGYHPYVKDCPDGWQRVPPQPAQ